MFALEGGPFAAFPPFFRTLHDGSINLNPARSRPAASSLPAGARPVLNPRIRQTSTMLSLRPASSRQERLSPVKARRTHYVSKPFRMCTYEKMGRGSATLIGTEKSGGTLSCLE